MLLLPDNIANSQTFPFAGSPRFRGSVETRCEARVGLLVGPVPPDILNQLNDAIDEQHKRQREECGWDPSGGRDACVRERVAR